MEGDPLPDGDRLWKQYTVLVDLYKYYLGIAWKAAVWYYATTGAILAFYLDNVGRPGYELLPFLLVFLAIMSAGLAYIEWRGARNLAAVPSLLEYIASTLRVPGRPHVEFAVVFLVLQCLMGVAVSVGSLVLLAQSI